MEFSKGLWLSTWSEASSLCTLIWMGFSSKILMAQGKAILSLSAYIAKRFSRKFLQLTFPMSSANFQLFSVTSYSQKLGCGVDMVCCFKIQDTVMGIMALKL